MIARLDYEGARRSMDDLLDSEECLSKPVVIDGIQHSDKWKHSESFLNRRQRLGTAITALIGTVARAEAAFGIPRLPGEENLDPLVERDRLLQWALRSPVWSL